MTREILFKVHVCANFSKIRAQNGIRTLTLLPFLEPEMVDHLDKNQCVALRCGQEQGSKYTLILNYTTKSKLEFLM